MLFDSRQGHWFFYVTPLPERLWFPAILLWCVWCVSSAVSPGVEWLRSGFDISFTSSGEAKNVCGSTAGPFYVFMAWWLINLQDDSPSANEPSLDHWNILQLYFNLCRLGIQNGRMTINCESKEYDRVLPVLSCREYECVQNCMFRVQMCIGIF